MASLDDSRIRRMELKEAHKRRKELIFVDARSATSLARNPNQIPGAVHVPVKQADRGVGLPQNRTVVTYCT